MPDFPATRLTNFLTPASAQPQRDPLLKCLKYNLEIEDHFLPDFHSYAASAIQEAYVDPKYLAQVLDREGFTGVAKLFEEKFPPADDPFSVRIGDYGEVVGHLLLRDVLGLTIPVVKIRYKTNWEKAAFGIDIIAFRFCKEDPSHDTVVFAEVKASNQKAYGVTKVFEEIDQLVKDGQPTAKQKMRNAVRFVSERLFEQQQYDLEKRIYRFLDCYTNPHYIETFSPILVRDKRTWEESPLSDVKLSNVSPDRLTLCIFVIQNLQDAVAAAYAEPVNIEAQVG